MKSAASEPLAYPGLTRLRHNDRDYVALGMWTDAEMIEALDRVWRKVNNAIDGDTA